MVFNAISPLMLWVRLPRRATSTTLCDKVCQWLSACGWFSPGTSVSSINKTQVWFGFMVFNATFNNISVISCRSVLLMEETEVPGENHPHAESHWQTLSHTVVLLARCGSRTHNISGDMHWFQLPHPLKYGWNNPSFLLLCLVRWM
jgi:hypothetical protein